VICTQNAYIDQADTKNELGMLPGSFFCVSLTRAVVIASMNSQVLHRK